MKNAILLLSIFLYFGISTYALGGQEKPVWAQTPPKPTSTHIYLVGIGEADKFNKAKELAEGDIKLQLIELAVGSSTSIIQKTTSTSMESEISQSTSIGTDIVPLKGLETESIYEESATASTKVYLLKRYPQAELRALKRKYESNERSTLEIVDISISTDTDDAKIFIAGNYRGSTPITLPLQPGTYDLQIQKSGFESQNKKLLVIRGNPQIIQFSLKKLTGSISIERLTPKDAKVFIDEQEVSFDQIQFKKLIIGKHRLLISAEGFTDFKQALDILPNQNLRLEIDLMKVIEDKFTSSVNKITRLLDEKKYKDAITYGQELYQTSNKKELIAFFIGVGYDRLNNKETALKWIERANNWKTVSPEIIEYQCGLKVELFEYDDAISNCKEGLNFFPDHPSFHFYLGKIYEHKSDSPDAEKYRRFAEDAYKMAAKLDPKYEKAYWKYCEQRKKNFQGRCR